MSDARFIVGCLLDALEVDHETLKPGKIQTICKCVIEAKNARDTSNLKDSVERHMTSIIGQPPTRLDITIIKDINPPQLNTKRSDTQTTVSVTYVV